MRCSLGGHVSHTYADDSGDWTCANWLSRVDLKEQGVALMVMQVRCTESEVNAVVYFNDEGFNGHNKRYYRWNEMNELNSEDFVSVDAIFERWD